MRSKLAKHKPKTYWSDKDKDRAVAVYKATGAPLKTAEITGIPYRTLWEWMKQEWWSEKMLSLKAEDSAVLEDASTTLAKKAQEIVAERLENGDFVVGKDGNLMRKPVSARDAVVIAAINIDKRRQFQEEPVREQQLGTTERLLKLVEQFALLTNSKKVGNLIEGRKVEAMEAEIVDDPTPHTKDPE
jgi:transposase-like protein